MKIKSIVLGITLALASLARAQTCDDLVAQGRNWLTTSNLVNANSCFSNAVAQCPTHESANVFYAVTRLLVLPGQTPLDSFMTRLGLPATGRDLYNWTAEFPTNADGTIQAPAGVNANEAQPLARSVVLPEIIGADASLAVVSNADFLLDLTSNETAVAAVSVDYGDILLLRSMLQASELLAYMGNSLNADIQLTTLQALLTNRSLGMQRLLADYPQLLTFSTTNDMDAAKLAFMQGVDLYVQASDFIRNRPLNANRLFNYDPDMETRELQFRETLVDLKNSLTNPVVWRVNTNYTFSIAGVFDGTHSPRQFLPTFTNNLAVEGTVPDPTFGGLIGGLSEGQLDDFLAGNPNVKSPDTRWWMVAKGQNFVQSDSGAPAPDPAAPFSFTATVAPNQRGSVIGADLTPPGAATTPLPGVFLDANDYTSWTTNFSTNVTFSSQSALETAYPNGSYGMTLYAKSDGTRSVTLALTNASFPYAPHISNFSQLQEYPSWQDVVLSWDPMTGGTTNDFIQVIFTYDFGYGFEDLSFEVFRTPDLWDVNALDGTATSVTIPANRLGSGAFTATITFAKVTDSDRRSFLAARGVAAYTATTKATIQATDIRYYSIAKGQSYTQTSDAAPVLTAGQPFSFQAFAGSPAGSDVTNLTIQVPGGAVTSTNGYNSLLLSDSFGSHTGLDAAFPDGDYSLTIGSSLLGPVTAGLSLTNDAYPNAPHISNYTNAQHIDGNGYFVLTWDAFAGGTSNDFIQVSLGSFYQGGALGGGSFSAFSSTPAYGTAGALDGTATQWMIPRNQLYAGQTYQATLLFAKAVGTNFNGYPGAPGIAGYYTTTTFQIHADQGLPSPDLAPVALTWSNAPGADILRPLQVAITVTNQGTAVATGWYYSFYLSPDGNIGANDTPVAWQYSQAGGLLPGASITEGASISLASVPASNCFLVVQISSFTPEAQTGNNTLAAQITLSGPDLALISVNSPAAAEPSAWIDVSWIVSNIGNEDAFSIWGGPPCCGPVWYDNIYFGTDPSGLNGRLLGGTAATYLAAGNSYAQTNSVRIPGVQPGDYFLSVKVDDYSDVMEICKTNNTLVVPIYLSTPATAPDLVPLGLATNAPAIAGMPLPVTIVVTNQGTDSAEPTWQYAVYLSSVPQWDASASQVGGDEVDQELVAGDTLTLYPTLNIPGDQYGARYLIVRLDTLDDIYELNEANNMLVMPVTITVGPPVITQQPADAVGTLNQSLSLNVGVEGTPPFSYQWRKTSTPIAGATAPYLTLASLGQSDGGPYDVVVSNAVGVVTSQVATVSLNLAVADGFNPRPGGEIYALAIQPDGKIVVGGSLYSLCGQSCANLGRLNADGTIDTNFNAGADGQVSCLALQPDGKILVGGLFDLLAGQSCTNLGRLKSDGTMDTNFISGADGQVSCLALQPDGGILVGGQFVTLSGQSCTALGRLNPDGTIDTNFNAGADGWVNSVALQPDGKVLAAGQFDTLGGQSCSSLGRLNSLGAADTNFSSEVDGSVNCLSLQPDGKILVAGWFNSLGGQTCTNLGRLNADGTLDTNFTASADQGVYSVVLQADGRVLVGGGFTSLAGQSCAALGRLNTDGTLDPGFQPITEAYDAVSALGLQADGRILVGGDFYMIAGQYRSQLARLINTDPATQNLSFNGSTITWLLGGSAPQVGSVTFDYAADGVSWTNAGTGLPAAGGWQLAGLGLPVAGSLHARGQVSGGQENGSAWFVESIITAPSVSAAPAGLTAETGEGVSFSVVADGSAPLSYQWLMNGGPVDGATNSIYSIDAMEGSDAGSYSVVVSNPFGSITSSPPAVLVWANPQVAITSGPAADARLTDASVVLGGEASDNALLAAVEWQLNNAGGTTAWQPAIGTTNWSATVSGLTVGLNTISFRARDSLGYLSAAVSRSYVLLTPLTVTVSGYGTLTDVNDLGVTFKEAGSNYTLTAVAGSGFAFQNWTGSMTATTAAVTFTMQPGWALQANFTPLDTNNAPWLAITSHTNLQLVFGTNTTLSGIAYDLGHGNHGITNVSVNKVRAVNDTAAGTNIAFWSELVSLVPGTNTFTVVARDGDGYSRTNVIRLIRDTTGPTITITSPPRNQYWSNAVLTATGTARDSVGVASVWYQVNSNGWLQASGTTKWTASLDLTLRTNKLQVYAQDGSGNRSAVANVTFFYIESDRLRLSIAGKGTLSPNYSNSMLEIGKTYTITAKAGTGCSFSNWTGGVLPNVAVLTSKPALRFVMQSNLVLQANFLDSTRPTLTIKSPLPNQQSSAAMFTIKGTASDNVQVGAVQYKLNGSDWQIADGTTNWSKQVMLAKGANTLQAFATDTTGNRSTTNRVSFFYNQFLALAGTYNGLFNPTNDLGPTNCGAITLTLGTKLSGGFSGKLSLQGTNLAFSSSFNADLQAPLVNVPRAGGKPPLAMALQLNPEWQDPDSGSIHSNVVTGSIADGTNWVSDLLSYRAYSGSKDAYAGNYTMLIGGSDDPAASPPGDGAGTVSVSGMGILQIKGNLSDKTPLTYSTTLSPDGTWPIYVPLYGGWGLFMGWMGCDTRLPGNVTTNIWVKPPMVNKDPINTNGFIVEPLVLLSTYSPTAAGHNSVNWTNGRVVLEFGDLPGALTNSVIISNNVVRVISGAISNLVVGITNKAGTFGGSFKHPVSNGVVKFSGVLVPATSGNDAYGGGWFVGPAEGGWVRLEPAD